jgi:hypothetical protein
MAETAAHLVDRVLPFVPVRQWVLSLPWSLRFRLAFDPGLTRAVVGVFVRAIFGSLRRRARGAGVPGRLDCGAVTFIQRAGGAVNFNLHLHTLVPDGVWAVVGGEHRSVEVRPLEDGEVRRVAATVARRVARLLRRRGLLEDDAAELDESEALLGAIAGASIRGRIATGPRAGQPMLRLGDRVDPEAIDWSVNPAPRCAVVDGFNVHANVRVPARDRLRLERLARYVSRPPIASERLTELDDGRLCYELRHRWRDGTTHVVLEPEELIERLAALVPRPRVHSVVYHGVVASAARRRPDVVLAATPQRGRRECASQRHVPVDTAESAARFRPRYYTWPELMRRVWEVDVLECPRCQNRLLVLAAIHPPQATRAILECLGLPSRAPPIAPARPDPPDPEEFAADWLEPAGPAA